MQGNAPQRMTLFAETVHLDANWPRHDHVLTFILACLKLELPSKTCSISCKVHNHSLAHIHNNNHIQPARRCGTAFDLKEMPSRSPSPAHSRSRSRSISRDRSRTRSPSRARSAHSRSPRRSISPRSASRSPVRDSRSPSPRRNGRRSYTPDSRSRSRGRSYTRSPSPKDGSPAPRSAKVRIT